MFEMPFSSTLSSPRWEAWNEKSAWKMRMFIINGAQEFEIRKELGKSGGYLTKREGLNKRGDCNFKTLLLQNLCLN